MKTKNLFKHVMTNVALTVATSVLFSGGVFAGNSAVINQGGGGTASIKQSGKNNRATIVQSKRPAISKKVRKSLRKGNRAAIEQSGDHNVARQTQSGEDNIGLVDQQGDSNTVTQEQTGDYNLAAAVQEGDDNTVTHSQTGDGHMQTIIEVGDGKTVTVSQSGPETNKK
jgi:Curlin associated repeat